jgi:vancomycin resistance protein YoaR
MRQAFLKPRAPVEAVVVTVEASITPEETAEALALVDQATSSPVTVKAGTVTAVIPPKAVGRALSFETEGGRLVPELDGAVLHRSIAAELSPIEVEGRDATFRIKNGQPKVVKSKVGTGVSDAELAGAVERVLALPSAERTVTVPVGTRTPALTTEQAKALGVKERLSTFTQNFPYAPYRVQNIGQAAERVNGTLLMPGETFSLNDTIKERTEENGYTEGFVVGEGGVFDEALGGGVSASATTVWTGAFFAGMERVQTIAHSIYISRYQPGLEATVAWGIFDMKFRNDTPNAVFITAGTTNTSMTVSFWGTKEYDEIKAEFGERKSIVPFEKIYDESEECLGQNGVDGFTITVDRVFYKGGEEVRREPITTRYKPAPDVTCGPKPDKKPGKNPDKDDQAAGAEGDAANGDADPAPGPSDGSSDAPDDVFSNE